ncbi:hypothetical protein SLS56_001495 [Neofusicoccum ribis]|uniref:Uncharacterized protein n=1 Tax=Neofusicoccum ribis TaxID=45134 RepID=A0ABR3T8E2_9PEZI
MSKRRRLESPEATGATKSLTDDGQPPLPHSGGSAASFLGLPRELRNMIYDEVLGYTIRPDIRHESQATNTELKRIRLGRAMRMENGIHTEIAMQPAYHRDVAPLLLVNHQINAEFSDTKRSRPHLFTTEHWSPPYGSGMSDESAEQTYCWYNWGYPNIRSDRSDANSWSAPDDRIREKLEYIQGRLSENLDLRACALRVHPEWQTVGGIMVMAAKADAQVAEYLALLSDILHEVDELNIELVLVEDNVLNWVNQTTNPDLGRFLAIEPLLERHLIRFKDDIQVDGSENVQEDGSDNSQGDGSDDSYEDGSDGLDGFKRCYCPY